MNTPPPVKKYKLHQFEIENIRTGDKTIALAKSKQTIAKARGNRVSDVIIRRVR